MKRYLPIGTAVVAAAILLGISTVAGIAANSARVWVQFAPGQKAAVLAQLRAVGGNVHHQFDDLEAVAVTLPEPALQGIVRNPNVVMVEEDPVRYLYGEVMPYGVEMVQAPLVWNPLGFLGSGVVVGVIDSGVYRGHEDLLGQSISGEASGTGLWYNDGSGHGTHVVGTILAVVNDIGVVGVAPEASVYMVKVFGDDGNWAYSSTLVYAVDQAIGNGASVISMSLGGGRKSVTEQRAFDSRYKNGILLIAAAGNGGTSALSYPASYSSVVSVAAVDVKKTWASFSQYNSQVELAAPGVGVLSTVPYLDEASVTVDNVTYDGYQIENAARGDATKLLVDGTLALTTDSAWSGKVVLVQRGDISFYDKVMNVQNSGGVAAIIYNNVPGDFLGTLGDGYSSTIPAISISQENGETLLTKIGLSATVVSTFEAPASGYAYYDGTSMATPHVSGVAALLWSAFPGKSNADIRTAMQLTAEDLGAAGRDNYYGYGLVQAEAAYYYLNGGGGGGGGTGDTTPPVISNVNSKKLNPRKFQITWTTDEPATTTVVLEGGGTFSDSALVTSHSMTFSGTAGVYTYFVQSVDAAGNLAEAGPFTHNQ